MTTYWKSTPRFYCNDCQTWINENMRKAHMSSAIHKTRAAQAASRSKFEERRQKKKDRKIRNQITDIEDEARSSLMKNPNGNFRDYSVKIKGKKAAIGPSFPDSYYKQKENEKKKEEMSEEGIYKSEEFAKNYKIFYEKFLEDAKRKEREKKLRKIDMEIQAKIDVENHFKNMLKRGRLPPPPPGMKLPFPFPPMATSVTNKKKKKNTNIIPVTMTVKNVEVVEKKKKKSKAELEMEYYNNPNFFYTMESEELHEKNEEKRKMEEELERERLQNKKNENRKIKELVDMEERRKKVRFYQKFENNEKKENVEESTGFGKWEDVEEEVEDDDDDDGDEEDKKDEKVLPQKRKRKEEENKKKEGEGVQKKRKVVQLKTMSLFGGSKKQENKKKNVLDF